MPQDGEFDVDEWGDLGALVTGLTAESLRRVADEEDAAGLERWGWAHGVASWADLVGTSS